MRPPDLHGGGSLSALRSSQPAPQVGGRTTVLRLCIARNHPLPAVRALSCAQHLQSIYVPHGQGGAYELRCQRCYSSAVRSKTAARIAAGILFLLLVLFLLGYCARS
jgi:hypothetical protein